MDGNLHVGDILFVLVAEPVDQVLGDFLENVATVVLKGQEEIISKAGELVSLSLSLSRGRAAVTCDRRQKGISDQV